MTIERPVNAYAGELFGKFLDTEREKTAENIECGRVVSETDSGLLVRKPCNNIVTITFSADLVTSNVINLYVTDVDGTLTAIAPVTFATDHVTTMGLIGDAITLVNDDLTCTVGGGSNRVLTIRMGEGSYLSVATVVVTAGASQATATLATTSDDTVYGVSIKKDYEKDSSGGVYCAKGGQMPIIRKGRIYIYCKGTFSPASTAYVRVTDGTGDELRGTLRLDSTNAVAGTGLSIKSSGTDTLALVELNLP